MVLCRRHRRVFRLTSRLKLLWTPSHSCHVSALQFSINPASACLRQINHLCLCLHPVTLLLRSDDATVCLRQTSIHTMPKHVFASPGPSLPLQMSPTWRPSPAEIFGICLNLPTAGALFCTGAARSAEHCGEWARNLGPQQAVPKPPNLVVESSEVMELLTR